MDPGGIPQSYTRNFVHKASSQASVSGSSVTGEINSDQAPTNVERPKKMPFKRGYVACMRCRSRKVKCVLDAEPPCVKCRREHRECVFKSEYKVGRQRQPPRWVEQPSEPETTASNNKTRSAGRSDDAAHPPPGKDFASNSSDRSASPRQSLMERAISKFIPQSDDMLDTLFPADTNAGLEDGSTIPSGANAGYSNPQAPRLAEQTTLSVQGHLDLDPVRQPDSVVSRLSNADEKTLEVWSCYSLVRQRWFTAQEAVTFVDLFFEYLSPMSPVLLSEYKHHSTHQKLISEEPMLCTTILMISSRFFMLPGAGGIVRSHLIHQRLWQCCRGYIEQIILGRGTYSAKRASVISIVDSCLLITDWHPRYANYPSGEDELGGELCPSQRANDANYTSVSSSHIRWREDILEPSKRSDHLSWMLLGTATNLAYKSGLFSTGPVGESLDPKIQARSMRTTKLLYVYTTNLSVRLGCPSNLPEDSIFNANSTSPLPKDDPLHEDWDFFMDCWIELIRLIKTASVLFFESPNSTQKQLLSGQYAILLDHFAPSLTRWQEKFATGASHLPSALRDLLSIEYQNLRVYTHALSMQAVVERALLRGIRSPEHIQTNITSTCFSNSDYAFLREVVSGTSEILKTATKMALSSKLRYMPVRQSLCFISAAIFLLKAVSIGSGSVEIQGPLDVLDDCIMALRSSPIDDMDFSSRFASLIEKRVANFRASFLVPRDTANDNHGQGGHAATDDLLSPWAASRGLGAFTTPLSDAGIGTGDFKTSPEAADWWARPFDPSIAPFSSSGNHISSGLELDSLDFLWNLPMEDTAGEPLSP